MKKISCLFILFTFTSLAANGAEIVSPFAGSTTLGEYRAEFVKYHYLNLDNDELVIQDVDGRIISQLYKIPEGRNNYEVFRSFARELQAAGFDILAEVDDSNRIEILGRDFHGNNKNAMLQRQYNLDGDRVSSIQVSLVSTQAQHYIAARKTIDQTEVLIAITTSRSGNYAIEQLESTAMETGTVALNLEALQSQMDNEGRMAIYGISFDTGSAMVKPESAETLDIIVQFLTDNSSKRFYVVGHTDDSGGFTTNMELSRSRAEAAVAAILERLPEAESRLQHEGVGPLSPVAINRGAAGRALNRRVELVETLD